jgi:hypothetical protein
MASLFPGMDPYLEPHWLDVRTSLVAATRRALNVDLPSDLVARVEERVAVESEDNSDRRLVLMSGSLPLNGPVHLRPSSKSMRRSSWPSQMIRSWSGSCVSWTATGV